MGTVPGTVRGVVRSVPSEVLLDAICGAILTTIADTTGGQVRMANRAVTRDANPNQTSSATSKVVVMAICRRALGGVCGETSAATFRATGEVTLSAGVQMR